MVLLSRLLFVAGFRLIGNPPSPARQQVWHVFRLLGNLVHEASHAVVLCVAGYRVVAIKLSIQDSRGRGEVLAQGRWHRLVCPAVGWAAASLAPVVGGVAAIALLMRLMGVNFAWTPNEAATVGEQLVGRWVAVLREVNFSSWQGWIFVLALLSIGAELAPSDRDLRGALPALVVLGAILCLCAAAFYTAPVGAPARIWFDNHARYVLHWILAAEEMALAVCGAMGVLAVVPLLVAEATRSELVPSGRRRVTTGQDLSAPAELRQQARLARQARREGAARTHRHPSSGRRTTGPAGRKPATRDF